MMPRKPPLISKVSASSFHSIIIDPEISFWNCPIWCQDHERAYFDSADWALGKVLVFGICTIYAFVYLWKWNLICKSSCFMITARCSKAQRTTWGSAAKVTGDSMYLLVGTLLYSQKLYVCIWWESSLCFFTMLVRAANIYSPPITLFFPLRRISRLK